MKNECCWMALNCQVSLPCNSQCKESHERNFAMAGRGNKVPAASLRVKTSARGDKEEAVAHLSQHQDHQFNQM